MRPGCAAAWQREYRATRKTVQRCWASLWTERAVVYRTTNAIDHRAVRLAVVIQKMIEAEVAGVLFTANPVSGRRRQAVIDASPGLGEAVVSGAVNPDHFVVDTATGAIVERRAGDKRFEVRPVAGGLVELGERDVTSLPPGDRGIGYVPQDAALFRTMTVYNHLAFALALRRTDRKTIHNRVTELADWLGITHLLHRRPVGLSGGEAQRVALGRALSFHPKYLLLDEPLSSLDEETRGSMIELLNGVRKVGDVTVLHVTHSSSEAERLADVRFRLADGRLVAEG